MSIKELFIVLKARWRSVVAAVLAVVTVVMLVSFLLPAQYTATSAVVLDVKSPDPIGGTTLQPTVLTAYIATEADVLQSERVALRAIESLQLDRDQKLHERWKAATGGNGDFQSWLAELVLRRVDVKPGRESNVLTVAYTSPSASLSAAMANAFVKAYIDTTRELRTEPAKQYNSFFDERAKQLREAVERAQAKLSAYQQDKGIVALDEKFDVENSRLTELSNQLVTTQSLAAESGSRNSQSAGKSDSMQEVLNNVLVGKLGEELSRQQARLNELSSRYGDNHPQVIELRASISDLKGRLNTEKSKVSSSVSLNNNVNQARVEQLRTALEEQRTKVLGLKRQRDEAAVLQRDVENAQRAYDSMITRVNDTSIESQNKQTNVSLLKKASPPPLPSSPKLLLNFIGALVLGLLLGTGIAVMRELRDPRLRTDDDVTLALGQPMLGVLAVRPSGALLESKMGAMRARMLGVLPQLPGSSAPRTT